MAPLRAESADPPPATHPRDALGSAANLAASFPEVGRVYICTPDKDMAQCVRSDGRVVQLDRRKRVTLDAKGVKEKFGIPPSLIIDFLALMGDKVDNIPGVAGVGEKTALGLLQGLGGLDDIYANLDKVAELSFRGAKTMAPKLEAEKASAEELSR